MLQTCELAVLACAGFGLDLSSGGDGVRLADRLTWISLTILHLNVYLNSPYGVLEKADASIVLRWTAVGVNISRRVYQWNRSQLAFRESLCSKSTIIESICTYCSSHHRLQNGMLLVSSPFGFRTVGDQGWTEKR